MSPRRRAKLARAASSAAAPAFPARRSTGAGRPFADGNVPDLGFGEHEWPDGKGTIELIAIDLVLAEIQLIVDDVEDGRIQDFIDGEGVLFG